MTSTKDKIETKIAMLEPLQTYCLNLLDSNTNFSETKTIKTFCSF